MFQSGNATWGHDAKQNCTQPATAFEYGTLNLRRPATNCLKISCVSCPAFVSPSLSQQLEGLGAAKTVTEGKDSSFEGRGTQRFFEPPRNHHWTLFSCSDTA